MPVYPRTRTTAAKAGFILQGTYGTRKLVSFPKTTSDRFFHSL